MKRKLVGYLAVRSGAAWVLRHALRNTLTVLAYHRIGGSSSPFDELFDESVYTCSDSVLDRHLQLLKSMRNIVSIDDVCDALDGRRRLPARAALITFDDATQDHYSRALPVLRKHGVPAVFFVSTRSLIERSVEWWNLLGFAFRSAQAGTYDLGADFGGAVQLADSASRQRAIDAATRYIKLQSRLGDSLPLVNDVAMRLGVTLPSREMQSSGLLHPEQLREMQSAGMTIGSHSHSHSFLRRLTPAQQLDELSTSKSILESIVARPVRALAYPYGQATDYDVTTQEAARAAGYSCAFNLMKRKVVRLDSANRFDVDRFPVPATADFEFEAAISGVAV
jgi:peptidoglycan/xylan/chitin deacetylase (PgdA/CDA1 family)